MKEPNLLDQLSLVKVFVFDVDGVLTNGQLLVHTDGTLLRSMNIKDGYALQLAIKKGYKIWIISGAKSSGAEIRLERLGLVDCFFAVQDKLQVLQILKDKYAITDTQSIAYMGDDMPDIAVMQNCGVKCAPADACQDVLEIVDYISPKNGGEGCVRDLIEKVMKMNGDWC